MILFERPMNFGVAVGVRVEDPADLERLHDGERTYALTLGPARRASFVAGRIALREAFARAGLDAGAILPAPRGGPSVPSHGRGSVTHKDALAVALARLEAPDAKVAIGVDLEAIRPRRVDVSARILRAPEVERIAELDREARDLAVLVSFSIKEAIYKALDPFVARWVGFKEVELDLGQLAEGSVTVLPYLDPEPRERLVVEASWVRVDGLTDRLSMILSEAQVSVR